MKAFLVLFALTLPQLAQAFPNEVECVGTTSEGARARVEIERNLGGMIRDARVLITRERGTPGEETRYRIFHSRRWGHTLEYRGDRGFHLEVDIFPDQAPRWGMLYRGRLNGMKRLSCQFTHI